MTKFDDYSNVGIQMIQLKLMGRETFLGTQKCFTDRKHELSLGEWIETTGVGVEGHEVIYISGTGKQMEPWKKLVLSQNWIVW